jgi:hypothetical protein
MWKKKEKLKVKEEKEHEEGKKSDDNEVEK